MDQVMKDAARNKELEKLAPALSDGAIFVDATGQIVWIDENLRRRLNGRILSCRYSGQKGRRLIALLRQPKS
jgi:hypothetical protein